MTTSYMEETLAQTDNFETILEQMETYYIGTIQQESVAPLPRYISAYLIEFEGVQEQPSDFERQLKGETEKDLNSWSTSSNTSVTEFTQNKLEKGISEDEFKRQLQELQDNDIKYATEKIKAVYSKVLEQGQKNPEQKAALIKLVKTVSEGIKKVVDIVANFLNDLMNKISEWLKKAYEYIKSVYNLVSNAITSLFS